MEIKEILSYVDHTLLDRCATKAEIFAVLDDAIKYGAASACIPPCYVKEAKEYVGERLQICTVIGFPNGYHSTAAKCAEAEDAIKCGADELDMVINTAHLRDGRYDEILAELVALKKIAGERILKVIIETCLLSEEEIIKMCELVTKSGADYIKTSTGFAKSGATFHDVDIMCKNVGEGVKVKAAGGISSIADAEEFIRLGAKRLGTSRIIKIIKNEEAQGY